MKVNFHDRRWVILLVCTFGGNVHSSDDSRWFAIDDEDGVLSTPELITKYGYQVENHSVTTEDGYELTIFRILPQQAYESAKLPVLMEHGLLGSAADFIIIGPNNSLAYLLSDNGYDVWLANARGTRYSREHSTLSQDSKEFWDFSWHEIGYYDLPATIEYILNVTSASRLHYVGYSQGSTSYFVMSSTRPEFNEKIALMVALAPSAYLKRIRSPVLRVLLQMLNTWKKLLLPHVACGVLAHSPIFYILAWVICSNDDYDNICPDLVSLIVGPNPEQYDQKAMTVYFGHTPAGSSLKQIVHYAQISQSGRFQQFDYGRKQNLQKYGSPEPPVYDLKQSSAPVALYYGLNDWLLHPRDVQDLEKALPRVIVANPVADEQFNHFDFILAKNVRTLVYDQVVKLIDEFN